VVLIVLLTWWAISRSGQVAQVMWCAYCFANLVGDLAVESVGEVDVAFSSKGHTGGQCGVASVQNLQGVGFREEGFRV